MFRYLFGGQCCVHLRNNNSNFVTKDKNKRLIDGKNKEIVYILKWFLRLKSIKVIEFWRVFPSKYELFETKKTWTILMDENCLSLCASDTENWPTNSVSTLISWTLQQFIYSVVTYFFASFTVLIVCAAYFMLPPLFQLFMLFHLVFFSANSFIAAYHVWSSNGKATICSLWMFLIPN